MRALYLILPLLVVAIPGWFALGRWILGGDAGWLAILMLLASPLLLAALAVATVLIYRRRTGRVSALEALLLLGVVLGTVGVTLFISDVDDQRTLDSVATARWDLGGSWSDNLAAASAIVGLGAIVGLVLAAATGHGANDKLTQ